MIFDADMDVVAKAARRWRDREAIRTERAGKPASETESRKRLGARIEHLARAASEAAAAQANVLRFMRLSSRARARA